MANTTDCLLSTVKNTSGVSMRFMFLPPHGRTLAAAAEYTFRGDPVEAISAKRANGVGAKRDLDALETALLAGNIEILKTPNPVLYDPTRDESMMLKLDNGILFAASPCWIPGASSSSSLGTPQD